jgi:phosphate transport system protein
MPRETFDRQIHQLQDEVLLLGSMVEQAMLSALDSLRLRDITAAKKVYAADSQINEKRFAIENAILIMIATQQPIARDLRMLAATLEIITELERMGDYAKGISKVVIRLGDANITTPIRELNKMAELATGMLHRALGAFIAEDSAIASQIPLEDEAVDKLYHQIYHILVAAMIADPGVIDQIYSSGSPITWNAWQTVLPISVKELYSLPRVNCSNLNHLMTKILNKTLTDRANGLRVSNLTCSHPFYL